MQPGFTERYLRPESPDGAGFIAQCEKQLNGQVRVSHWLQVRIIQGAFKRHLHLRLLIY